MLDYLNIEKNYLAQTYNRFPVFVERGEGCRVYDFYGKEYIDFTAGIGVNSLGYKDAQWVNAVSCQAARLAHISNLYYTEPMLLLAEKLCKKTGMKKAFFCNSGAESNETAVKIARKYANQKYGHTRNEILTLANSFHGRTIATLSATGQDVFHKDFGPFLAGFAHTEPNDIKSLKSKLCGKTIAVMIEIIQGEGGILEMDKAFLEEIAGLCKEQDVLLIVDEVQSGIGRTGRFCAYEHYGILPDIVTFAKGLGGGLPIGAVLIGSKCENVLVYADHGSTFGANPVACAGANVVLDKLNAESLWRITEKGKYIKDRLVRMPHILSVNGMGLMIGCSVYVAGKSTREIVNECAQKGLLLLTAKDRLRFLPPLTISTEDINCGMDILEKVLTNA